MKSISILNHEVDFLYLIGGLVTLGMGIHGLSDVSMAGELFLHLLFGIALVLSSIGYLQCAFHLTYPNNYMRASLLLILLSIFPYLKLESLPVGDDVYAYIGYALVSAGAFVFLEVSGLILLLIGHIKGRTNLEDAKATPVSMK